MPKINVQLFLQPRSLKDEDTRCGVTVEPEQFSRKITRKKHATPNFHEHDWFRINFREGLFSNLTEAP